MADIPKIMLKPRKARTQHGPGESWYYIVPSGLEVCVANKKGEAGSNVIKITAQQMRRALKIIEENAQ